MTYLAFSLSKLLNFDKKISNSFSGSEMLENILTTAVCGFALVFVIMALIWLILEIFGKMFSAKKPEKEEAPAEAIPAPAPAPAVTVTETVEEYDELELVAAITAAISAYENKPVGSFRVVSFRKKR